VHILFLTDNFPPEVNAPASRTHEHCREWVKAGHRVTVVTCVPNFPTGKPFHGYRNRLYQRQWIDGIRVLRVWSYMTANEGFVRRTLDYASYMVSAILASPFIRDVDVVVATSPHLFTACAGYAVGKALGKPFVFELRDLWPESIRAVGAMSDGPVLRMLERLELFLYRKAAAIVSVTQSFRDNLISRGIDGEKISVVTNGGDLDRFMPMPKDPELVARLQFEDKFVAGYVGTHGMAHGLGVLLDAAGALRRHEEGDRIRLLLLGDGAAKRDLEAKAAAMNLTTVQFLGTVPKSEVPRYWSLLDASIIHLRKNDLFKTVIPSKLFECMAMGIPVLHGIEGESAAIVESEQVGIPFEPENAAALCQNLLLLSRDAELRKNLSENGRQAAIKYDRSVLARRMLDVLEDIVRAASPSRIAGKIAG